MSQYFVFRLKKITQILFFALICGLFVNTTGCGLWRKPWKYPGHNANSHSKYGKELPEVPFYTGHSQNELIDQAAVLRNTAPQSVQDSDFELQEEKVPWYKKRPLLMSSKASEIDNHLGK